MAFMTDWYPLMGMAIAVFVAGFGIVKFTISRLDKKTDKETCEIMSETFRRELARGDKKFDKIQESQYAHGMLLSNVMTQVEGINKRLDKANGDAKKGEK